MLANTTLTVSEDVLEIFNDPDISFKKILIALATEFGEDATLQTVHQAFQDNKPVAEHMIGGVRYLAGYRGRFMQSEGTIEAKLIQVVENGTNIKCMFNPIDSGVFVYYNFLKVDIKADQVVKLTGHLNKKFTIEIKHEIIPATGDKHAIVAVASGIEDLLEE